MSSRKSFRTRRGGLSSPAIPECPIRSPVKAPIICVAYLLYFPLFGVAQSYQFCGVVHDGTGAIIPGASVALRQTGSDVSRSSQTDDQGTFQVALPAAGTYQLEISASGFAVYRAQVILAPGAPLSNLDIVLAIEGNSQTVEVTANALAAETTSTQLGESLDTKKIEAVPLNGRSFTDLMAVQPGIVPQNTAQPGAVIMTGVASTPPSGDANPGNLSISGQRESSNGFRVNGSDVEEDVNMGTSILPNLDAIDSFRVLTSNFDAEYGNSSGGQVLVTTKAGTTHTHGSAFEFLRNTALDARNYFSQDVQPTGRTSSAERSAARRFDQSGLEPVRAACRNSCGRSTGRDPVCRALDGKRGASVWNQIAG